MSYQHYQQIKPRYPEHVLIISIGDWHMTYDQDASVIAQLYNWRCDAEWATFAEEEIDRTIVDLIAAGHRVAIAQREA